MTPPVTSCSNSFPRFRGSGRSSSTARRFPPSASMWIRWRFPATGSGSKMSGPRCRAQTPTRPRARSVDIGAERWQIYTNDQANHAEDYRDLVLAYRNGDSLKLKDVADVQDSVQDLRNLGLSNGKPAVLVIVFRQPGANIISTVDEVRNSIPRLKAALPAGLDITFAADRSTTIRASLHETEMTLIIAIVLVIGVVFVFLCNGRAAAIRRSPCRFRSSGRSASCIWQGSRSTTSRSWR